jgi:dGTPase
MLVHTLLDLQMADFLKHSSAKLQQAGPLTSNQMQDAGVMLGMSPTLEQEKQQLEEFLFEHVYRHERLIKVRDRAAIRLKQLYRYLSSHPEKLPPRVKNWSQQWGRPRAIGAYLAGMTDRFCDEQYLQVVEMGRPCGIDWS